MKLSLSKEEETCALKLRQLIRRGYQIIGRYGRNAEYLYLKKGDNVAKPFCLTDTTFNR